MTPISVMKWLRAWYQPLLLGLLGTILYTVTLAPTVTGTDAGELILAATRGGVAHAPGFPTWLMLAGMFSLLGGTEPARLLNVFSALTAATTLPLLWAWLGGLPHPRLFTARSGQRSRPPGNDMPGQAWLPWIAFSTVLVFATGRSFWPWATTAEVYTLNALLIAVTLYALMRWQGNGAKTDLMGAQEVRRRTTSRPSSPDGFLLLAALAYGLALGAHLATTALLAPAIALWLYWHRQQLTRRLLVTGTLLLILGLATYAWLPWRASAEPVLNWGETDTLYRFWRHVTAAQYRSNINLDPASILNELIFGLRLTIWAFSPLGVPLILWGLWWGWRHQRHLTFCVLVGVLTGVAYAVLYAIEDDQDAYYIVAHMVLLVPLFWGLCQATMHLLRWGTSPRDRQKDGRHALTNRGPITVALLLLLVPLLSLLSNWQAGNRRAYWYAQNYYHHLSQEVASGGTVFTRDWQLYSPSLYYQHVLGDRPDLRIIDVELMRRDWYLNDVQRWYPDLVATGAEELALYRRLRDAWEQDPAAFEGEPGRVQALQSAYIRAINALIRAAYERGDVHVGHDMEEGIGAGYVWQPVGLTFRLLAPDSPTPSLPDLAWDLEAWLDHWQDLPDDPARKIVGVHSLMLQNRAIYLARQGDREGALVALDLAIRLNPTDMLSRQLQRQLQAGGAGIGNPS